MIFHFQRLSAAVVRTRRLHAGAGKLLHSLYIQWDRAVDQGNVSTAIWGKLSVIHAGLDPTGRMNRILYVWTYNTDVVEFVESECWQKHVKKHIQRRQEYFLWPVLGCLLSELPLRDWAVGSSVEALLVTRTPTRRWRDPETRISFLIARWRPMQAASCRVCRRLRRSLLPLLLCVSKVVVYN